MAKKMLSRLGRVAGRVIRSIWPVHRTGKIVVSFLVLLLGYLGLNPNSYRDEFFLWLEDDPGHALLLIFGVVCIFTLRELYRVEKESEEPIKVRVLNVGAQFHDIPDAPKVLAIQSTIRFHNRTNDPARAYFPKIEVLYKAKRGKWTSIPITSNLALGVDTYPRGHHLRTEHWYPDQKFQIGPRDDTDAGFTIECEILKDLLSRDFKIRFLIEIIGQREIVAESVLPEIRFA
jgi:hypothetical protein